MSVTKSKRAGVTAWWAATLLWASLLLACAPSHPTVEQCAARPLLDNYSGPDAVSLSLRFENKMSREFKTSAVCIDVDGRSIRQDVPTAVAAGFDAHRPLEMRIRLRPGVAHRISVIVEFAGTGSLEGYRLTTTSARELGAAELNPGTLTAEFTERGGAELPPERRPSIEWSGPGATQMP